MATEAPASRANEPDAFCRSCRQNGHLSSECPVQLLSSDLVERQPNTYFRVIHPTNSKNYQRNKDRKEKRLDEKAKKKAAKDERKVDRRKERIESMNKKGGYPVGARIVREGPRNEHDEDDDVSSRSDPSDSVRPRGDRGFRGSNGNQTRGIANGYQGPKCFICHKTGHLRRDCPDRGDPRHRDDHENDRIVRDFGGKKGSSRGRKPVSKSPSWSTVEDQSENPSVQVEVLEAEVTTVQFDVTWRLQEAEDQIKYMASKIERLTQALKQLQIKDEAKVQQINWLKKEVGDLKVKNAAGKKGGGKDINQGAGPNERQGDDRKSKVEKEAKVKKPRKERKRSVNEQVTDPKSVSEGAKAGESEASKSEPVKEGSANVGWNDLIVKKDNKTEANTENDVKESESRDEDKADDKQNKVDKKKSPFRKSVDREKDRTPKGGPQKSRNKYKTTPTAAGEQPITSTEADGHKGTDQQEVAQPSTSEQ